VESSREVVRGVEKLKQQGVVVFTVGQVAEYAGGFDECRYYNLLLLLL
jgi:hypothetical protein